MTFRARLAFALLIPWLGPFAPLARAESSASPTGAIVKADQTIAFLALVDQSYGATPFAVTATASSGLAVKFASQTLNVCKVAGSIVSLKGTGTCTLRASQPGNANYNPAPAVDQSFTVDALPAVVTLGGLNLTYRGRSQSASCTTIPTGLKKTVIYSDIGSGIDHINAGNYGVTCTVTQMGYAGEASGTLIIEKASQTVAFGHLAGKTYGDPPFAAIAKARSGLAVSFTSLTSDVCTMAGDIVTLEGAGTCTIRASQTGNANYNPAGDVDRSFKIAAQVTLGDLSHIYDGTSKFATCTTLPAGLTTLVRYRNVGAGTGRINAGSYGVTCTVTEASCAGRATSTLMIAKASQTITLDALADKTIGDAPFAVMTTASSGLAVSLASLTTDVCTVAGNTVTLGGEGTCTLQASQAGSANYNAAVDVEQSVVVAAGEPSTDLHYVVAYDSALQGNWNIHLWEDADHPVTANPDAAAPGRPGNAIEVQFSPNGWGAFGLANMTDWNNITYMYLNEFRTIEFDIYFEPDSTGVDNLQFLLEDGSYSNDPMLVSYIPGWDPAHPENIYGQWIPVVIDLTQIGATIPSFTRFMFWNGSSNSSPHFRMANVRLGWMEDTTPPIITLGSAMPSLTYDQLALAFTTDQSTIYRVDYGIADYGTTIQGDPGGWAKSHTAVLTGLSRGHTYQYRVTAWDYHTDPSAPPTPATLDGTYTMPAVPTMPPIISSFTATPASVPVGESSTLTWVVTDYDTLSIAPTVGSVTQVPGATGVFVSPTVTTSYTITATNAIGTVTSTLTVTTQPVPTIHSFVATPASISAGGTSTLTWAIDNFDSLSIDHGVGPVTAIPGATGVPVNPADTTTYTLTASNAYGTVLQTATVTIDTIPMNPVWVMGYYVGYQRTLQPPDKVDYSTMTHIMVASAVPTADGTFDTSFWIDSTNGPLWAKDTVDRAHAAGIKAILMLGGSGSVEAFRATSNPVVRAAFVSNLKTIMESYGFDGIDMDWEPLEPTDGDAIIALMEALQAPGALPRNDYIYTVPVGWNNANFNNMADPFYGTLSTYFDRVTPMSYGMVWFGGGWQSWHSSALFGQTPSTPTSIDDTVQALRAAGVPDAKIGVGVGFYGTAYENGSWSGGTFVHANPPDIPAYVTAPHQSTETSGNRYNDNQASYSNLMQYVFVDTGYRWDDTAKVPYLTFATPRVINIPGAVTNLKTTYVTYDNEQSIAEKASYVRKNGLGGVIIWSISQGYLGNWKASGELDPLMKIVKETFLK